MNYLLAVTALIAGATGLVLVALPSALVTLLLGPSLETPAVQTHARVAGVALLALTCWFARPDERRRAARGLVGAMVPYSAAVALVLAHPGVGLALSGIGLWPTVALHATMALWCLMRLSIKAQ